jgi:uncharacterized protein (TIGR01639 family)
VDKLLGTYTLTRLNHEGIKNLNRPITSDEIELAIKSLLSKKKKKQMASLLNSIIGSEKNKYQF